MLLLPLLAAVDDATDESTTESDELGLCGMAAVAASLVRGPIAVIEKALMEVIVERGVSGWGVVSPDEHTISGFNG